MARADIDKWISGETAAFFDPFQTPPFDTATGGAGNKRSSARPSVGKFARPAIAAAVGVCASIAMVCFVIPMRHSVEPSPAAYAKSEVIDGGSGSARAEALEVAGQVTPPPPSKEIIPTLTRPITRPSDAQLAAFLNEVGIWYDRSAEAAQRRETNPSPPHPLTKTLSDVELAGFLTQIGIWYDRRAQEVPRTVRKPLPPRQASRRHWPRDSDRAHADREEVARLTAEGRYVGTASGVGNPE